MWDKKEGYQKMEDISSRNLNEMRGPLMKRESVQLILVLVRLWRKLPVKGDWARRG